MVLVKTAKTVWGWVCRDFSIFDSRSFFIFFFLLVSSGLSYAERLKVVSLRGTVRVYYPNGEKERAARGQILETDQRWVLEKGGGLYLEGDMGSKISFINSGVIFFRKNESTGSGWQLEVAGKELYVNLSSKSDLWVDAPKLEAHSTPVEFYYESKDNKIIVHVLLGDLILAGEEESILMKRLVVEGDSVDPQPFNRSDFYRYQLRHENNALGRDPDRNSLRNEYPLLPWRMTMLGAGVWSHLLPEHDSTFSQDRFGWSVTGSFARDFLLRRPLSPDSTPWMPRLRIGPYFRIFRPGWHLAPNVEATYRPLVREFGITSGLAWDGFFLMGQVGFVDYSSPFTTSKPYSTGLNLGFEGSLSESPAYHLFWQIGAYYSSIYAEIDQNEVKNKGISHGKFHSVGYGILMGPSLAF